MKLSLLKKLNGNLLLYIFLLIYIINYKTVIITKKNLSKSLETITVKEIIKEEKL